MADPLASEPMRAEEPRVLQAVTPVAERRGTAIAYRLAAATGFAVMAALIKVASQAGIGTVELMFWRFAFGLAPLFLYVAFRSHPRALITRHFGAHLGRAALGLTAMFLSFRSLAHLPLAEATTISFAAPLFAIAMSALLLGEKVGPRRWSAVAIGFVGVLVVADPGGQSLPVNGLLYAIGGTVGVALVTVAIRRIGRTEPAETTVFWFAALSLPVLGALLPAGAASHDAREWVLLLAIGLAGGAAQLFMTRSLGLAPVPVIAPFDYSQLVWAVLLGWLLWSSVPTAQTWVGATIIAGCGVYSAYRERTLQRLAEQRSAAADQPLRHGIGD